jgi:hypothetical protein
MTDEKLWAIWDEVIGIDTGINPIPYARAVLSTKPDITEIKEFLACEIECRIFEKYVLPALEKVQQNFIKE